MPVGLFYRLVKIKRPLFRAKCAMAVTGAVDRLFVDEAEPRRLSEGVAEAVAVVDAMELGALVQAVPAEEQELLREASRPTKFLKKLRALQDQRLVDLEIDDLGRIFVTATGDYEGRQFVTGYASYNARVRLLQLVKGFTREAFKEQHVAVLEENFEPVERRLLTDLVAPFFTEGPPSIQWPVYFTIKKAVAFQLPVDEQLLAEFGRTAVEEALAYLQAHEIVSGCRSIATLHCAVAHSKFRLFLGDAFPFEGPMSDRRYFEGLRGRIGAIVNAAGSIDFDQLLFKARYLEEFELKSFFEACPEDFEFKRVDDFLFISMKGTKDPFA